MVDRLGKRFVYLLLRCYHANVDGWNHERTHGEPERLRINELQRVFPLRHYAGISAEDFIPVNASSQFASRNASR